MSDQQRIKRLYPFLRRAPRIEEPLTITETVVETRFQTYGGPYIVYPAVRTKTCSQFFMYDPLILNVSVKSKRCLNIIDTTTDFFVISSFTTTLTAATP